MCRSKAEGGRRCRPSKGRGPSVRVDRAGGSAPPGPSGRMRRRRAAVLQAAQKQLGDLLDAAVDAAPVDSAAALVSAADAQGVTAALAACGMPRLAAGLACSPAAPLRTR